MMLKENMKEGLDRYLSVAGRKGLLRKWLIIPAVLLCVIGLTIWVSCRHSYESNRVPEVTVVLVDTASVDIYGEFEGNIRASQSVEVTARVEGILEKMLFKEGSYVHKGQILFVIDPKLYQAHVDRARAQLDRVLALKDKAQRDLNRIRPLYLQKAASQLDLDNAEAALECAEADVEISRVDLIEAQISLGYTRVAAPISGYISERMVDVGALVGPGSRSLLATIVRSDTVMVDFSMTSLEYLKSKDRTVNIRCEDDGECIRKLPSYVRITLADGTEYPYLGLVDFADPMVDSQSGTFSVRAEMPNPERRLLPGEKTKVKVLLDVEEHALTVPAVSVRYDGNERFVYVVTADGVVKKRKVTVGASVDSKIIVEDGLHPGEMVATDGFEFLRDSIVVRPEVKSFTDNSQNEALAVEVSI